MQDIKKREEKMRIKRKNTPFRDFLKDICSWYSLVLYRNDGQLSKYPNTDRKNNLISFSEFDLLRDNLTDSGLSYDLDIPFFDQYGQLLRDVKFPLLANYAGSENCEFADAVLGSKTVYLSFGIISNCENILYSVTIKNHCTNILNGFWVVKSENLYLSTGISSSYNIFYSKYLNNCRDIWFSVNLSGCTECIRCKGLDNKSYCIDNVEYVKDQYFAMKKDILSKKESFDTRYQDLGFKSRNFASTNIKGINIIESTNITNSYNLNQVSNGNNLICVGGEGISKDIYDVYGSTPECVDTYGSVGVGVGSSNIYNSSYTVGSTNIYYSYFIESCSYCLGCIGLRNKQFCILNKQYSKEERFKLANEIFAQMDQRNVLGNFFPGKLNPFYFNDSVASLIDDDFTKEEVAKEGYLRRDEKIKVDIPEGQETIKTTELNKYQGFNAEGNREINPEILKKVIIDEKGNYYRIVKLEYDFLVKHGLPLPEIHRLDRIKLGFRFK